MHKIKAVTDFLHRRTPGRLERGLSRLRVEIGRSDRASALGLLRACHPVPTLAVTALTAAVAAASGRDAAGCGLVAGAVLAGQLSIGWCNDAADAERDTTSGRTDKPVVSGAVSAELVRAASITALAVCVPLSFASGPKAGAVHLIGVAAAWAYDLGLKSTAVSWVPYAVGFGSLPAFVALGLPGHPWPAWPITLAAAALGCGAHLANVLPDIESDLATGVNGWPQRLGPARVRVLIPIPLLAATGLLVFGRPGPVRTVGWAGLSAAGTLTAAGWLLGGRSPRVPFATAIAVAAVDVALLVHSGSGITATRFRTVDT